MVCANKDAYYVREFDVLRKKLGLNIVSDMYQTVLEYELQGCAAKFAVEARPDHVDPLPGASAPRLS
jgi:hypothetical protein